MTSGNGSPASLVEIEYHPGWAALVLNRPFRRNALTGPMMVELTDAITELADDESVAAIVMRGAYGYFCSGIDLKELQAVPQPPWVPQLSTINQTLHRTLFNCEVPIIGALEGFGINAGSSLALASDLIVGGETAFLQVGEIRQGAGIPMNAAWIRLKTTESVLARLALMGDRVETETLLALGLIHEVVPDDEVRGRAEALAAEMAQHPKGSTRTIKAAIIAQRKLEADTWFGVLDRGVSLTTVDQLAT